MKRFLYTIALLAVWMCGSVTAASLQPRLAHPYLYCTDENIAAAKAKIQSDTLFADAWQKLQADADRLVADSRVRLNRVDVLGLAYRMTGEVKYADKVKNILLAECDKERWGERMLLNRTPPWNVGLNEARNCYSMAVGFDCIYDILSDVERERIAQGLIQLGILPTLNDWLMGHQRIHTLDSMGHNWWSACVYMAGVASLAVLNEEPQAQQWLSRISEASEEWFHFSGSVLQNKPANFDRAGGFYESINYASFGMSEYLLFRLAWQNSLGAESLPNIPLLDHVGDFFIQTCYPNSGRLMSTQFGDSSIYTHGARPVMLLYALGDRQERYLWYLDLVRQGQFREGADLSTVTGLLFRPSITDQIQPPKLPTSVLMEDIDWAMLRSSWDKDATLLAIKCGFSWNHAHADAGSFMLFHQGEYILIDSGNCSYILPEYTQYYCQSTAHSVVLFNGQGQNVEDDYYGCKHPGQLYNLMDTGNFKYLYADATGPYAENFSRNFRHFLWIGDVILIIDDLKTHEPGQFEWLLHYAGQAQQHGQDLEVTQGDAKVLVRPLFPAPLPDGGFPHDFPELMRIRKKTGLKDRDPKTEVEYLALLPPEVSRRTKFVTALIPLTEKNQNALPKIERLQGQDMIGVRLSQGDSVTEVYFNLLADGRIKHRNSNNTIHGYDTDALLTAVTHAKADPQNPQRIFMAHGSYLRRDGTVLVDSLSKIFLVKEENDDSGLNVILQGQPRLNVSLHVPNKPESIILNGEAVTPEYEDQTIHLKLKR